MLPKMPNLSVTNCKVHFEHKKLYKITRSTFVLHVNLALCEHKDYNNFTNQSLLNNNLHHCHLPMLASPYLYTVTQEEYDIDKGCHRDLHHDVYCTVLCIPPWRRRLLPGPKKTLPPFPQKNSAIQPKHSTIDF